MTTEERRNELEKLIMRRQGETLESIANKLGVSKRTVQRDSAHPVCRRIRSCRWWDRHRLPPSLRYRSPGKGFRADPVRD